MEYNQIIQDAEEIQKMLTNTKSELNKIKWRISINSWLYSLEHKKIDRKKTL